MRNGLASPTEASGSSAVGVTGRQSPGSGPITRLKSKGSKYPSFVTGREHRRRGRLAGADAFELDQPVRDPSSVAWYAVSSAATWAGATSLTSTWWAAVAMAASADAHGCTARAWTFRRYGLWPRSIALTAS